MCVNVFFIVTCPGPKKNGDGTAADGVKDAIEAASAIMTVNAAIFVFPPANSTAPMLKNSTIVTVLDRKFVIMIAKIINTTITPNGESVDITGFSILLNHNVIPVASDDNGAANTDTVPAKMIGGHGTCLNAFGTSKTGLLSNLTIASTQIARIAGTTTPSLFKYPKNGLTPLSSDGASTKKITIIKMIAENLPSLPNINFAGHYPMQMT